MTVKTEKFDSVLGQKDGLLKYFSKKYEAYPEQSEALEAVRSFLKSDSERSMLLQVSTAGGKSDLAMTLLRFWQESGKLSTLLAPNNEQVEQFIQNYTKKELFPVYGSSYYKCQTQKNLSCGDEEARWKCDLRAASEGSCGYRKSLSSLCDNKSLKPLIMTPYVFMSSRKNKKSKQGFPASGGLLIVDEAHLLPELLAKQLEVKIPLKTICKILDHDGSPDNNFRDWFFGPSKNRLKTVSGHDLTAVGPKQVDYLRLLCSMIDVTISDIREKTKTSFSDETDGDSLSEVAIRKWSIRHCEELFQTKRRLELFIQTHGESPWAAEIAIQAGAGLENLLFQMQVEKEEEVLLIRPGVLPKSFLADFFSGYSKIILMSGTIFPQHILRLGLIDSLSSEDSEDGNVPGLRQFQSKSVIAAERRILHIDRVHGRQVTAKTKDLDFEHFAKVIVDVVSPKMSGMKGIIHVTSKADAEKFSRMANHYALRRAKQREALTGQKDPPRARFISPDSGDLDKTLKKFKDLPGDYRKNEPVIYIVLARRYEGLDLRDDQARINIILKVPQANHTDTVVKSVDSLIPNYSSIQLISSVEQAGNRTTRYKEDWSLKICLDTSVEKYFLPFFSSMPSYVQDSWKIEEDPDWLSRWRIPR